MLTPCPVRGNLHHLLTPRYDQEASRTRMAVQVRRDEKSNFVTKLEEVLPLLRERFGVAKIGIFGSTARGDDRPESDVDVLVEFAPGQTTFRNFMELAFYLEDLFGRRVDLVTEQGLSRYIRPNVEQEVIWCDS
jgi:predicted nucleotidyltransferase